MRKFFVIILTALLVLSYGSALFALGRATAPKPTPEVYVVPKESSTTLLP